MQIRSRGWGITLCISVHTFTIRLGFIYDLNSYSTVLWSIFENVFDAKHVLKIPLKYLVAKIKDQTQETSPVTVSI